MSQIPNHPKCAHCGGDWKPNDDGIIGERNLKTGKLLRDNWIEWVWMRLGYVGKRVCSECYFK